VRTCSVSLRNIILIKSSVLEFKQSVSLLFRESESRTLSERREDIRRYNEECSEDF